jgi:hypothetical protein
MQLRNAQPTTSVEWLRQWHNNTSCRNFLPPPHDNAQQTISVGLLMHWHNETDSSALHTNAKKSDGSHWDKNHIQAVPRTSG